MNFEFSAEQQELRRQARRFFESEGAMGSARRMFEGAGPHDCELWRRTADLGWLGVTVAEEFGGSALSALFLCVIAEEAGRSLAPIPISSSIYVCEQALGLAGSRDQKAAWLPPLADGSAIGTFA